MAKRSDYLRARDGAWYYWRRTPTAFAELEKRTFVRVSLKIAVSDDPKGVRAARAAVAVNAEIEAYWRGLVDGRAAEAAARFKAARVRARMVGFDYATAEALAADRPVLDVLARIEELVARREVEDPTAVSALLGGEPPPEILLSGLIDAHEAIVSAGLSKLSPDQLRKWRNPKKRALANLLAVIGDKPIAKVTRGDALDFRAWWAGRIATGGIEIATANKDIGHLNRMLMAVADAHQLGFASPFARLRIEGGTTDVRSAFEPAFVEATILAPGALGGLNAEAQAIIAIIAETGLRLSEACNLGPSTIVLDHKVPHVQVRADGRVLKTPQSERDIPLVGVALSAARAFPAGFPRYRDKAASLSALANKVMDVKGLRPTPDHSVYSLRHTFEDRLTAVEAPEKLIAALMGHKYGRPRYGKGPSLDQKLSWLSRIVFTPPAAGSASNSRAARSTGRSTVSSRASSRSSRSKIPA